MIRIIGMTTVIVALAALQATAAVYVVDSEGTGDYPSIQAAIDAVVDDDIIELLDGTYAGEGNRDIDFSGKRITVRSQNGLPEACVIDCERGEGTPYRGFLFHSGETDQSLLEGVTITGGWTTPGGHGACIACEPGTSPTIANCRFTDSAAEYGGGLWCDGSSPTLIECVFIDNSGSLSGGGVYCSNASPNIIDCSFVDNYADRGGGIACVLTSVPNVSNCTFTLNYADQGAAIYCKDSSTPLITSCTISGSAPKPDDAVIHCLGTSSVTFANTIIAFSSAGVPIKCLDSATVSLTCCAVFGNAGGDWVGCISEELGSDGNLEEDPLFCNIYNQDFTLCANSNCAGANNTECGQIGAYYVGCEACITAVEIKSWGSIKTTYE